MNEVRIGQAHPGSTGGERARIVVIADDEKSIADTLSLILASKGYTAEPTYDGLSALEACRSRAPDLLISDLWMPRMNGVELGIAVRSEFPDCQILLFVGQAAASDVLEEARSSGHHFELLQKPVHPQLLLERVEQLIGMPTSARENIAGPGEY